MIYLSILGTDQHIRGVALDIFLTLDRCMDVAQTINGACFSQKAWLQYIG